MWNKISFERQELFDEVWAAPVRTLAKKYGLSDVGLRKICMTLDVPMPPRGHWAKLAAGKSTPKPVLRETTSPTTYERMVNVMQVDDVIEERVTAARNIVLNTDHSGRQDYLPPLEPTTFSPQTKLVLRALKSAKLEEGALSSLGGHGRTFLSLQSKKNEHLCWPIDSRMSSKCWAQNLRTHILL